LIGSAHTVERAVKKLDVGLKLFNLAIGPGDEYDPAAELLFKRRKNKGASAAGKTRNNHYPTASSDFRCELLKLAAFEQAPEEFSAGQRRLVDGQSRTVPIDENCSIQLSARWNE
jgi:hypothetical protein